MKILTDTAKSEWEEIVGCKDIRQVSGIDFYLFESMAIKSINVHDVF